VPAHARLDVVDLLDAGLAHLIDLALGAKKQFSRWGELEGFDLTVHEFGSDLRLKTQQKLRERGLRNVEKLSSFGKGPFGEKSGKISAGVARHFGVLFLLFPEISREFCCMAGG